MSAKQVSLWSRCFYGKVFDMSQESSDGAPSLPLKPSLWRQPGAWFVRKLKLKLADLVAPFRLRVIDGVDFSALRIGDELAHVLDVGAADGTPDLYQRLPTARLDLFEPQPCHHDTLCRRVLSQRAGQLHPVALGEHDGSAQLALTGRTGASLVARTKLDGSVAETIEVPVRRLDSIIKSGDLRRPCLLKIDTEGYELAVLRGATEILAEIDIAVVEVHFDKPHLYKPYEIIDLLGEYGLELVDMLDHHVRSHHVVCADLVFERRA